MRDQQWTEKIVPLQGENPYEKWQGKLRLELRWIYSRVKLIDDLIVDHKNELERTNEMKKDFQDKIVRLKKPFWWMDKSSLKEIEMGDPEALEYNNNSIARAAGVVTNSERQLSSSMNAPAQTISGLLGYSDIPWFKCLKLVTYVYIILTLLVNFIRPDFVNLTL